MPKRHNTQQALKQWLDQLQQESWQLELVVSGFAIFLVLNAREPIWEFMNKLGAIQIVEGDAFLSMFFAALLGLSWFVLITNLILHVVFRGLWISVVGLRYVSGDIHYRNFKLQPRFEAFLRRRLKSFDDYILFLEKLCSLIFAFTFLLLFISASFVVYFLLVVGLEFSLDYLIADIGVPLLDKAADLISIAMLGIGILYFVDFLSLSRIKRLRWLAPVYYPLYRLMGWLTLARLYRPLYYNLIDDRFGRNFALALIPYLIFCFMLVSLRYEPYTFMPTSYAAYLDNSYYEDTFEKSNYFKPLPSIPSRHLDHNFLEVFVPYLPFRDNPAVRQQCPDLPAIRETGLTIGSSSILTRGEPVDSVLNCMAGIHQFYLNDSLIRTPHYYFHDHPRRNNLGILYVFDVADLPHGVHELRVEPPAIAPDTKIHFRRLEEEETATIVFYKE